MNDSTSGSGIARRAAEPETRIERLDEIGEADLENLCDATNEAIIDGEGFGWLAPPPRHMLEAFWRGVLLVPERAVFVARMDSIIVGSIQLVRSPANNQSGAFAASIVTFFIAPWARGHGLARGLLNEAIDLARRQGSRVIDLDVRADRKAAISLFEAAGFERWGEKPKYAMVDRKYVPGYFYSLTLNGDDSGGDGPSRS
jgi:ribosomal protein S18 acetylase RimI-like enzyme